MREQRGFTLMMVSVGIVLISLFAAASVGFRASQSNVDRKQITINKMNAINDALTRFAAMNGRLPCPASPTATPSSSIYGTESRTADTYFICNAPNIVESSTMMRLFLGAIPTRTLGLPDEYMIDGWGNKLEYSPSPYLYKSYNEDNLVNYIIRDAAIVVNNASGTAIGDNAAYVIISRGANGYGAYNAYSSNRNAYPPASLPIEQENSECYGGTCGSGLDNGIYQIANNTTSSDDILVYKNKTDFINDCFIKTNSLNCLTNQCVDSAAPLNWQNAVRTVLNREENLVISSNTTPPSLDINNLQLNRKGSAILRFKINAMATTNATIRLNLKYATTAAPTTIVESTIVTFSTSSAATYTASSIGSSFSPLIPGGDYLFKELYFTISTNGSPYSAYMAISNITISDYDATLSANGNASVQYWKNTSTGSINLLSGFENSNFILNPTYKYSRSALSLPDSGYQSTQYYIEKLFGYITPTTAGTNPHTFYLSSDDDATFWLSDGSTSNRLNRIATLYKPSPGNSAQNWTQYASQTGTVSLTGGKSYYFEVWHRNSIAGGFLYIGWKKPGDSSISVIPNSFLSTIPKEHISSEPVCKAFYTTTATLTPAQTNQPADIIPLNNTYGRYVKLSLLSNQTPSSGQDSRQDVYFLSEVRFRNLANNIIIPGIFMTSSNLYVDNANTVNDQPYQGLGLLDTSVTSSATLASPGDFITNGQYKYSNWVTQNTRSPQYVIFDLGSSIRLKDILIWNGNQLFTNGGVTCCPGRSVKDVRVSVSDDPYFLIYHAG
ncbi:PA14 domain-containing protein [Candidatus Jidaibacter acanthamoebae]|nr:PA14 domain-containing protein [Candidatus Jidaibacter acanthamoeba]